MSKHTLNFTRERIGDGEIIQRWNAGMWSIWHLRGGDYTLHAHSSPLPIARRLTRRAAELLAQAMQDAIDLTGGH